MNDYDTERIARQQIAERVQTVQRSAVPSRRRRRTVRAVFASGLHHLADRLDG